VSHPDDDLLLIEGNHVDGKLGRETLTDKRFGPSQIEWTKNLSEALERLSKGGIEAVLRPICSWPTVRVSRSLARPLLAAPRAQYLSELYKGRWH
jgi:hypothetical protein